MDGRRERDGNLRSDSFACEARVQFRRAKFRDQDEGKMRDVRVETKSYLACFDGWNAGKYCLVMRSTIRSEPRKRA